MTEMNIARPISLSARLDAKLNSVNQEILAMFDQAIVSGLGFLTSVAVGRYAGKSELGVYALGMSVVLLCISIQQSLVSAPHTIFVIRHQDQQRRQYNGSMFAFAFAIMSLIAIGSIVVSGVLFGTGVSDQWSVVAILAIVGPAVLLREFCRKFLYANHEITTVLWFDVLIAAIQITVLGLLVWTEMLNGLLGLAVIAAACLVIGVGWFTRNRDRFKYSTPAFQSDLHSSWDFGKWVFAGQVSVALMMVGLNWLLVSFGGTEANGAFGACMMLILLANPFVLGIQNLLSPRMAKAMHGAGRQEVKKLVNQATLKLGGVMAVFTVGVCLLGSAFVQLVYSSQYSGLQTPIMFLAFGALALSLGVSSNHGLRAIERPELNFLATGSGLVVTLLAACLLIPRFGVTGAAVSYFIGHFLIAVVRYISFMNAAGKLVSEKPASDGVPS